MNTNLQSILLKAKEDVYTYLSGGNLSRILGQGYDFAELRPYEQGDDIRHISWINSAKLGQPYVKRMHEERELNIAVCALLDGRFVVGNKRETLAYTLAVLGYSAYRANDSFTLLGYVGKDRYIYEPTKDFEKISRGIEAIYRSELLGSRVDYHNVGDIYLPSKSLLFVIGDFLESIDLSILAQKHEVVVIMIRDPLDESPTPSPFSQLMSPYTHQALSQTLSQKAVQHYLAQRLKHDEKLMQHLHQHNIRYIKISDKDEVVSGLSQLFFL